MAAPEIVVVPDADVLAAATAARLITALADAQAARGSASVVLTGGGIGIATLRALRDSPARDAVDWSAIDVWWGDERFVPADDGERNEGQAREALLDHLPALDPTRVHAMPPSDGTDGDDVDAAADRYAKELDGAPLFDVLLLGVGGDGHTASIFPGSPAAHDERPVVPVRHSPKPPPTRISLGFPALRSARQVWMVVAGEEKAPVVAKAVAGADPLEVPAAGPRGTERTLWLLDAAAASALRR